MNEILDEPLSLDVERPVTIMRTCIECGRSHRDRVTSTSPDVTVCPYCAKEKKRVAVGTHD